MRGLKRISIDAYRRGMQSCASKHQNPREGIKTDRTDAVLASTYRASKHQNPREGIKTYRLLRSCQHDRSPSKHQNPREGIKTYERRRTATRALHVASKHQNPREGIKTRTMRVIDDATAMSLQNTKIPVRGLKPTMRVTQRCCLLLSSKHQNPREGIKTSSERCHADVVEHRVFKTPKSP